MPWLSGSLTNPDPNCWILLRDSTLGGKSFGKRLEDCHGYMANSNWGVLNPLRKSKRFGKHYSLQCRYHGRIGVDETTLSQTMELIGATWKTSNPESPPPFPRELQLRVCRWRPQATTSGGGETEKHAALPLFESGRNTKDTKPLVRPLFWVSLSKRPVTFCKGLVIFVSKRLRGEGHTKSKP